MGLAVAGCARPSGTPLPTDAEVLAMATGAVSWCSMLYDASDLVRLSDPVAGFERSMFFSSHAGSEAGRTNLAHLAPEVLGDMDHGFFLRVEPAAGATVDAVLAEAHGAGAVTWVWSANPVGELLLFVDDPVRPVLRMPFQSFLGGAFLPLREPYAALTAHGHNLHFPIVHARYMKLALRVPRKEDLASLFYQVAWNAVDDHLPLRPFSPAEILAAGPMLTRLGARFAPNPPPDPGQSVRVAGHGTATVFERNGSGMVRELRVDAAAECLSNLWIRAWWDGERAPAVECPLLMLAGASVRGETLASMPVEVVPGTVLIRWPMAFAGSARIELANPADRPCRVAVAVSLAEAPDADRRLRFRTSHVKADNLAVNTRNVLALLPDQPGPGRIAGLSLRVDSRSAMWWGEGDPRIWLDDFTVPAWVGTGTEDYFGFAWCSNRLFEHAFRGQSQAEGGAGAHRVAAMRRYHLLDRLPFHRFARFQMEAHGLGDGFMDYEALVVWYGPGAVN